MIKLDKDALAAAISACREYTFAALTMDECGDVARKVVTTYLTEAALSQPANPVRVTDARYDSVALEAARDIIKLTRRGEFDDQLKAKIQVRIIEALAAAIGAGSSASDAQIEHMVQQFLRWKLPDDLNPDNGISFTKVSNIATPYEYWHEPVGTNLFDYKQAKAMVQHMLEGVPLTGTGEPSAARSLHWIDVLREWFGGERYARDYEYLDANYSDHARRVAAYAATLSQPHPADERVVEALREDLRQSMLKQTISGNRETYSDGFSQGLCFAIERLDALSAKEGR